MIATYHRLAVRDVRQILDHYEEAARSELADRFYDDLMATIEKAVANPRHFSPLDNSNGP